MAEAQTFYLVVQASHDNSLTIERMKRCRILPTAQKRAFELVPSGTSSFMVLEEAQAQNFANEILKVTRHLIGEE